MSVPIYWNPRRHTGNPQENTCHHAMDTTSYVCNTQYKSPRVVSWAAETRYNCSRTIPAVTRVLTTIIWHRLSPMLHCDRYKAVGQYKPLLRTLLSDSELSRGQAHTNSASNASRAECWLTLCAISSVGFEQSLTGYKSHNSDWFAKQRRQVIFNLWQIVFRLRAELILM